MTISVAVADDQALVRVGFCGIVAATPGLAVVGEAANGAEAVEVARAVKPDVILMDVRMPDLDGIEVAQLLQRFAVPPAVIFVTAYEEYAVRAFDIGACDYLLKPVSRTRLGTALDRALGQQPGRPVPRRDDEDPSATIPVEIAGRTRLIPREQVRWVEAEGDYVRLHTTDGSAYLVRMPISHLEERWAAYGFIRIHRSFLVPFRHITEFSVTNGVHAVTVHGQSLPVSRRHVRDVRDRILRSGRRN
jgi:DNA-binding LytR/AlgR family response regulator